MVISEIM